MDSFPPQQTYEKKHDELKNQDNFHPVKKQIF